MPEDPAAAPATSPGPGGSQRWRVLHSLRAAGSSVDEVFERIAALARRLFNVPFAAVSLLNPDRPGTTAPHGLRCDDSANPGEAVVVVSNAARGEILSRHIRQGWPRDIRFHASCQLRDAGYCVGSLELVDRQPRSLSTSEISLLRELADLAALQVRALATAATDELTRVPNRRGFHAIAERILAALQPPDLPVALLAFDLDGLKKTNDGLGHGAGDRLLARFAQCLLQVCRESDAPGRLGGDEFCLLLVDTDGQGAVALLERLQQYVMVSNARQAGEPPITFGTGIAVRERGASTTLGELLAQADRQLLEAKTARR